MASEIRHDWTIDEIRGIFDEPLLDLIFRAAAIHRQHHDAREVQVCKLIPSRPAAARKTVPTARSQRDIKPKSSASALMDKPEVLEIARRAKAAGVSRVCMGAAWRKVRDNKQFDRVLDMVKEVTAMGVEVCCTLGMLTDDQARRLDEAGLYAYNHNLDNRASIILRSLPREPTTTA